MRTSVLGPGMEGGFAQDLAGIGERDERELIEALAFLRSLETEMSGLLKIAPKSTVWRLKEATGKLLAPPPRRARGSEAPASGTGAQRGARASRPGGTSSSSMDGASPGKMRYFDSPKMHVEKYSFFLRLFPSGDGGRLQNKGDTTSGMKLSDRFVHIIRGPGSSCQNLSAYKQYSSLLLVAT